MSWSGKMLGGVFGGLLAGPVGAGVGVALGHYLADSEGARRVRAAAIRLDRLEWQHHVFSESGPGVLLTPVWRAKGLIGVPCRVRIRAGDQTWAVDVEPEHAVEECHLPEVHVPYGLPDAASEGPRRVLTVSVRVEAPGRPPDRDRFTVSLPSAVRQLGGSGPARVVMAMVACARAGDRLFTDVDEAALVDRVLGIHPLDESGHRWLSRWTDELCSAALDRLTAEKVARRLAPHLDEQSTPRVLRALMAGVRQSWPGEAQVHYVDALGAALGQGPGVVADLWRQLDTPVDDGERRACLAKLGLADGAGPADIRAAWLALVRRYHPDHAADAAEAERYTRTLARINAAYDVLAR